MQAAAVFHTSPHGGAVWQFGSTGPRGRNQFFFFQIALQDILPKDCAKGILPEDDEFAT